jgi:hypothetical protein
MDELKELKELMDRALPLLALFMFSDFARFSQEWVTWRRKMAVNILRDCLGRDPTEAELVYYENELELRNLKQRAQDRQKSYEKIRQLVWGR